MTRSDIRYLMDRLTDRDHELIRSVDTYRLLTTKQLQRLHFDPAHPTSVAAARACNRALLRLRDLGVLATLQRRIGGVRAGSAGFVWYLGPAGERLLLHREPGTSRGRRNYREPSRYFTQHTLAVAELAVQAIEASRDGSGLEVLAVDTEPASWQQSLSAHGTVAWLKPDLRLVTATAEEECHWFLEADLDTEHLPVVLRQCAAYAAFRAAGRYQADHRLFPAVVWITPTEARAAAIRGAIATAAKKGALDPDLFQVCTTGAYIGLVRGDPASGPQPAAAEQTNERGGQKGGTPS